MNEGGRGVAAVERDILVFLAGVENRLVCNRSLAMGEALAAEEDCVS